MRTAIVPDSRFLDFDPTIVQRTRHEPPALPLPLLGPWAEWIEQAADNAGAPPDYVVIPLLVSIAALVGNARKVVPYEGADWSEPFVLWGGVVGDPSSNKSPAADPVLAALRHIEREENEDFEERKRLHQSAVAEAKERESLWEEQLKKAVKLGETAPEKPASACQPEPPAARRIVVSDATPEKVAARHMENPRGLLSHRDELAGWIASFERYNGDSRTFWIEGWGARPYGIDRMTEGRSGLIPRLSLSVLGTIQPDKLAALLLKGDDDGLPARFLWVWPNRVPPRRPGRGASQSFVRYAFGRLRGLRPKEEDGEPRPLALPFSAAAADAFDVWRGEHDAQSSTRAGLLASAWGKMPGLLVRLAGVLQMATWAAEGGPEPSTVDLAHFENATALLEGYFKPMATRVYADASVPSDEKAATALARFILADRPRTVNVRDLHRQHSGRTGITTPKANEEACEVLVAHGWLAREGAGNPHRPRKDYVVNPAVEALRA
jgi:putative DNA primase/helicase